MLPVSPFHKYNREKDENKWQPISFHNHKKCFEKNLHDSEEVRRKKNRRTPRKEGKIRHLTLDLKPIC